MHALSFEPGPVTNPAASGVILVAGGDERDCARLAALLTRQGYEATTRTSARAALAHVACAELDVVLADLRMTEMTGLLFTERVLAVKPDTTVIAVTDLVTLEDALAAVRAGAFDFLTRPLDESLLGIAVGRAMKHKALRDEVQRLRRAVAQREHVTVQDLPEKVQTHREDRFVVAVDEETELLTMDELERRYIARALALAGGNKSRVALLLGFDRRTLYRKLERYAVTGSVGARPPQPERRDA